MTGVRVTNQDAFVLHVRPYRETSAIVELMTLEHGRISVVARGVRGQKRKSADTLIPFVRLLVGWSGRGQLRTLTSHERTEHHWLVGESLYAGLYVNELMLRLLRSDDPHAELFWGYGIAVTALAEEAPIEELLRRFEKLLLKECGYELVFDRDADTGERVDADAHYLLEPDLGFRRVSGGIETPRGYPGAALLAIATDCFDELEVRRIAKRIMREALAPHLGDRPLHSRALFRAAK